MNDPVEGSQQGSESHEGYQEIKYKHLIYVPTHSPFNDLIL